VRHRFPSGARARIASRLGVALTLAFAAVLAASLSDGAPLASQTLDLGDENSWIRIQNVGNAPATIEIDFYDPNGNVVDTESCPEEGRCAALRPGFGWSFFQQLNEGLPAGYRGSGFVTADQPFVALLARDVLRPDGTFQIAGDSLRLGTPTSRHFAPLVQNTADFVSRISVENTSDEAAACVELRYYAEGGMAPVAVDPASPSPGCARGGTLVSPRGTLLRDERNLPVPFGFDGAVEVRTHPTDSGVAADDQQPSLVVDTRGRSSAALASYRGLNSDELSRVVVLPLVDRNASEAGSSWSTRFRIFSGTPSVPNEVTLLFEGRDGEGNEVEIEHTVTVQGARTCDQRFDGAAGCLPDDEPLPSTFVGTVRMQAVEPVAVVAQRLGTDGSLADYRGFIGDEASRQVVLPVVNKNFGSFGEGDGWNSWFRVLTFDGSTAHVHIAYYSRQFPNGLISRVMTVEKQRTFRQWEDRQLPDGWVGSAVVVADRPVVVIANLESDVFRGDPVMLYNGISLE
jgi:hypothetical protein